MIQVRFRERCNLIVFLPEWLGFSFHPRCYICDHKSGWFWRWPRLGLPSAQRGSWPPCIIDGVPTLFSWWRFGPVELRWSKIETCRAKVKWLTER